MNGTAGGCQASSPTRPKSWSATASKIGRDPATIKRSAQAVMLMSNDAAQLRAWHRSGLPRIIGTPSEIADVMARYGEVGVDEFVVADHSLGRDASQKRENMDRFVEEVAVHLQERSGS